LTLKEFQKRRGGDEMNIRTKISIALGVLIFVTITFFIATQSYLNNKELRLASDRCYENGGYPKVESDSLTLHYSFICENVQKSMK
jgi:hypothetical protein